MWMKVCGETIASSAFIQDRHGLRDLLVLQGTVLSEYSHTMSVLSEELWKHDYALKVSDDPQTTAASVSLAQNASGKFEAIARVVGGSAGSGSLVAYELDSASGVVYETASQWQGPVEVVADGVPITNVSGATALVLSDFFNQERFELLVPRGAVIDHYTHDTETILQGQWSYAYTLAPPSGNAAVVMSAVTVVFVPPHFSPPVIEILPRGMLEAVARVTPGDGNDYLVGYVFDPTSSWSAPVPLVANDGPIDHVTGSSSLVQRQFVPGLISLPSSDRFDLLVPRGNIIDHYRHTTGTIVDGIWEHAYTLVPPQEDPKSQFKGVWLIENTVGKLEAVARVSPSATGASDYLVGYDFDAADGWRGPVRLIADDGPILAGNVPTSIG